LFGLGGKSLTLGAVGASISSSGAILLGRRVACDAHKDGRPVRVVTHAHYDHILGLERSLRYCRKVVMTPATRDILQVLRGVDLRIGKVSALNYGERLELPDGVLELRYADHIIGSAQVLLETENGTRIAYTGDFKFPGTPALDVDVLVMEATYGAPNHVRPPRHIIERMFTELVEQQLSNGPVCILGYHGKLQEVMQILFDSEVWAPVILPKKVLEVSKVCERYGMRLGDYIAWNSEEARELIARRQPYIALHHINSRSRIDVDAPRIYLTGWEFRAPVRKISDREYVVALSDHADFPGLLAYVEEAKPKLVITDNYREGYAKTFARELERRLGIPAKPLP